MHELDEAKAALSNITQSVATIESSAAEELVHVTENSASLQQMGSDGLLLAAADALMAPHLQELEAANQTATKLEEKFKVDPDEVIMGNITTRLESINKTFMHNVTEIRHLAQRFRSLEDGLSENLSTYADRVLLRTMNEEVAERSAAAVAEVTESLQKVKNISVS